MTERRALSGRIALVTGGSSGIGRAVALALADYGARVMVTGRDTGRLREAASTANGPAPERYFAADLAKNDEIEALSDWVETELGGLDILVHSAAMIARGSIEDAGLASMDEQYRINLRAPYQLTSRLLPMLRHGDGDVVFVNSSVGVRASAGGAQYAATKHGLKAIADSLREEVNRSGIRVLTVYLGRTATPMQARLHEDAGADYQPERLLQPEDVASAVVATLLLPRTAEVTDLHIRPAISPG